jgi:hypothetical protein
MTYSDHPLVAGTRWLWRAALLLVTFAAMIWTGAFVVGCSGLNTALESVNSNPTLAYTVPKDLEESAFPENAAPYFASSFALLSYAYPSQASSIETVVMKGWDSLTEEAQRDLRTWFKDQHLTFDIAARGAGLPQCRYAREWWRDRARTAETEPWRIPIPELKGVEQLCDALIALAHSRMADGKTREAREAIRIALAVADSLREDPFLASQRRRVGHISFILDHVAELVPPAATADDLGEWLKLIPGPETFDGCLERAAKWMLKERVDLFSGSPARYWFWQRLYYRWGPMDLSKMIRKRLADPIFEADAIKCLEGTARLVEIWGKPYFEARPLAETLEKEWSEWKDETWHPTAPLVWGVKPLMRLEAVQEARARCALIRAGLEWEIARASTGAYPKTVEATDPLTGHSFRLEEGRIIGANITKQGGRRALQPVPSGGVTSVIVPEPNTWELRAK